MEESNLKKIRLEKLEKLKALGVNAYPASFDKKQTIADALKSLGKKVKTAGKIFSYREHGNIAFADLKDESGKIQLFLQKKLLGEEAYKNINLLDIGDYIGVEGEVVKTTAGEISIAPTSYTILTKSLLPLPSEFFGLKDAETKFRKRYLDLILNPELREIFRKKNLFWQTIREYLVKDGGLEVETPVLVNTTGGADARPFTTRHFAFDMDVYLRISPELYLKRLLVAGFEKVFEIGRIFRNEGVSDEHLQDYTQMEMYWAYKDYEWLMDFVEKMTQEVIKKVFGTLKTKWKNHSIDWSGHWPRIEFIKLLSDKWDLDVEKLSVKQLHELAKKLKVKLEPDLGRGRILDNLYKKTIRPNLIQPMYIINHPVEVEPLAKRLESNPNNVARMQILAMGSELGKGFSELNDPIDQYERFREQQALRDAGDEEAQMMDEDFVEALEYGMPPAAGFAYSERLFAMLMDKPVRELQFFPLMKPEHGIESIPISKKANVKKENTKQDFTKKIAMVISKNLEAWQAMNALAHMSAYIGNKIKEDFATGENFVAKDNAIFPRNSQYPIIVLSGDSKDIISLVKKVKESGLLFHVFIKEMIETTDDEKIIKILSEKKEDEVEYLGIGIFGDKEKVSTLIKNFSLWK